MRTPRWGWLYATFGLMVGLFYLEGRLVHSGGQRTLVQLLIVAFVYFLVHLWIVSNTPFDNWS